MVFHENQPDQMEEEVEASVTLTQKTTVASVIKETVKVRGSYQQTSVENALVEHIQLKLTIQKSMRLLRIAKQEQLPGLKQIRIDSLQKIIQLEIMEIYIFSVEDKMDLLLWSIHYVYVLTQKEEYFNRIHTNKTWIVYWS